MSTNQTTTSHVNDIVDILASDYLRAVQNALVIGRLVAVDFQDEVRTAGKTVDINTARKRTARTKAIGTAATVDVASTVTQSIILNTHVYDSFNIEDVEQAWARDELSAKHLPESAYAIASKFELAIVTAAEAAFSNIDSGLTAAATFDKSDMIVCDRHLTNINAAMNPMDRIGVLGSYSKSYAYEDNISVVGADTLDEGGDNLRFARLGQGPLHGINWYQSNNIGEATQASPAITYEKNLIFDRKAIQVVHRPLPEVPGEISSVATDPNLGLSVRITVTYEGREIGHLFMMDMLYGIKVLNYSGSDSPTTYLGGIFRSPIA